MIPNLASSLPNRGILFRVMSLQTHRYIKQTFPFFERGSPFRNEFASVLRKMEYWAVTILAFERRLQSPVTKSEGWITLVSLERLHLLPPFPRLFIISRTTHSSVNWQMDAVDTDFLICWVFKPKVSSTAFFLSLALLSQSLKVVKRTNFQLSSDLEFWLRNFIAVCDV